MIIKGLETDNQKMNGEMYPRLMMKIKRYGEAMLAHLPVSLLRMPREIKEESDKKLG